MLALKVTHELNNFIEGLKGFEQREIERIVIKTLNAAAYDAQYALKKEMLKVFDRPTPHTLNSLLVRQAKPGYLVSEVAFKEFGGKGNTAGEYLKAQVEGGTRARKRSEKSLVSLQANGQNLFLTPGPSARLNQYGNIPAAKYVEVISYFKAFNQTGFTANRSKASTQKRNIANKFLMALPGDSRTAHLSPGIYERTRQGFVKIFNFSNAPVYKQRFDFYGVGFQYAASKFRENFFYQVDKVIDGIRSKAA